VSIERVETARLVGTKPVFRDAEELHAVMADERVAEWMWPGELGGPRTLSQVRAMLVRDADHWKRHRFGAWVVRDRATHRVVGRVGLQRYVLEGTDVVEAAWLIGPDRWGEGLATEMAAEAVRVGFEEVGLEEIVAFTLHGNLASQAVMRHLGFEYEREIEHAGMPHVLHRLRRR
jgi:RimJ/RimL family protein N-acetyltransferase